LEGALDNVAFETIPFFQLEIPVSCPEVPAELLNPRNTWQDSAAYDQTAKNLAIKFQQNFKKFEAHTAAEIVAAGPQI